MSLSRVRMLSPWVQPDATSRKGEFSRIILDTVLSSPMAASRVEEAPTRPKVSFSAKAGLACRISSDSLLCSARTRLIPIAACWVAPN